MSVLPMRLAIQGEMGSNSHLAAMEMFPQAEVEIVPCGLSAEAFDIVVRGDAHGAVLPIENSLHGSVAEHYDYLWEQPVRIAQESMLRVRHNVIAMPGVRLGDVRRVLSHPVALSQCRRWLGEHREIEVVPFYDTAGSVKQLMAAGWRDAAGIAPQLAARVYGGEVLVEGIEDRAENFTRFHLVVRESAAKASLGADKMSVGFSLQHRPGTLVEALEEFSRAGVNLTKIESRPVPGRPWEYVFYVDVRFESVAQVEVALQGLGRHCESVKELGRYCAA